MKPYYPEAWKCSLWQVDNQFNTFLALRTLHKPPFGAALDFKPDSWCIKCSGYVSLVILLAVSLCAMICFLVFEGFTLLPFAAQADVTRCISSIEASAAAYLQPAIGSWNLCANYLPPATKPVASLASTHRAIS